MPFRLLVLAIAAPLAAALFSASGAAAEFVDAAGRHVALPDRIERVMAANEAAAVFVFVLAPQKLVGWPQPLSAGARAYLPRKFAALPIIGRLSGPAPTADAGTVASVRPDLIIDCATVTPAEGAFVERIERETRVPTILIDNAIEAIPVQLRALSVPFGAVDRGFHLARLATDTIDGLRGTLLTVPPTKRPRVYYGLEADGLSTGAAGSTANVGIDEEGAINVAVFRPTGGAAAAPAGSSPGPPVPLMGPPAGDEGGALQRVSLEELRAWNPSVVIAQRKSFYDALKRDPAFAGLAAVREGRVYLVPDRPFGWLDRPAGVNRLLGLDWLSALLYRKQYAEDFATSVRDFYEEFYGVTLSDKALAALLRGAGVPPTATEQMQRLLGLRTAPLGMPPPGAPMRPGGLPGPERPLPY